MGNSFLQQAIIFLSAALVCVPLAKKLGIGSVLGYLLAGIIIGPFVLQLVGKEGEDIMHASEFGVVMMLFLIGLELNPSSFWKMRKLILGLGLSQVILSAILIFMLLHYAFNFSVNSAIGTSLAFALSSTAIVLQTLKEKGLTNTQAGKASFAVLLMQDVAVIPILAILPLLATQSNNQNEQSNVLITLTSIGAVVIAGRFLINPFLQLIARTRIRELFIAAALLIVVGVAYLMQMAGISAALGTFMAGVLLANSEFRHELESDVEPFKGILLGVFFTAVGTTINFHLIAIEPFTIISLTLGIMLIKTIILMALGKTFSLNPDQRNLFAFYLCGIGEFAFVLLASAKNLALLDNHTTEICMAVATISMALTPILVVINERLIDPYIGTKELPNEKPADEIHEKHEVIIAGFGHFGSTTGRFLRANGIEATILDNDSDQVDFLRKMGFNVYYGDSTRLDLLKAAGAENAKYLISALPDEEATHQLVEMVQKHFPHLKLFVRSKNRFHAYDLINEGITHTYRDTLHTSVYLGVDVLKAMGFRSYTVTRKAQEFIKYDEASLHKLAPAWKNKENYILNAKEEIAQQEELLQQDNHFTSNLAEDNAWDSDVLRRNA
jgi:CPA2 family monovalent cation:H+ antiporter-2